MSFCYFFLVVLYFDWLVFCWTSICVLETTCLQWLHLTVGSNIGGCEHLRTNLSDHNNHLPTSGHPIFRQSGKTVCLQKYCFHVEQHESKQILNWFLVGKDTLPNFSSSWSEVRSKPFYLRTYSFLPAHGESRTLHFFLEANNISWIRRGGLILVI